MVAFTVEGWSGICTQTLSSWSVLPLNVPFLALEELLGPWVGGLYCVLLGKHFWWGFCVSLVYHWGC